MKSLFTFLLALVTVTTFAQKTFQGKATYMSKTTMDMSRFGGDQMSEQRKKQIMARMKNFFEKTYTLTFNKTASSFKENVALEAPGSSGGRSFFGSNGQGSIYKNTKDKKMIQDEDFFGKRFLIVEEMEQPQWEMGIETKKIGQYTAYKATMTIEDKSVDFGSIFGRRGNNKKKDSTATKEVKKEKRMLNVTAWYTPQIPVSAEPDKYYGLPGLILELNAGRTTMLCTEILISSKDILEIKEPKKGKKDKEVTRDEYNKIVKIKSKEIKERNQRGRGGRGGRRRN